MIFICRLLCMLLASLAVVAFFAALGAILQDDGQPAFFPVFQFVTFIVSAIGCLITLICNLEMELNRKGAKDGQGQR